ncbi:MAG: winged helix-turn-helix domain-containing protein [Myxococcales bacterium]|nr:winged helix-turn-helix domain-containing protein [Myxococcales bacterium]
MSRLELCVGTIHLETGAIDGSETTLTVAELSLLLHLLDVGVASRHSLQTDVLGFSAHARTRAVEQAVHRLRRKIEPDPKSPIYVLTERGQGYRWAGPQPSTRSIPRVRNAEPNAFVGRSSERAALLRALDQPGIVTLRGPGGVGKTRLSLAVLSEWMRRTGQGAFADLSAARTVEDVVDTMARALGAAAPDVESLGAALGARGDILVVVDNFEQLLPVSSVLETLRRAAPSGRLLVTSRSELELESERVVVLSPLGTDDAVDLLCRRAAECGIPQEPDEAARALVHALDGLPLAVELAAARLSVFTPSQILCRLDERLDVLSRRRGPARHATLRDALDWSWSLLSTDERTALMRLVPFLGGSTVEAAEVALGDLPDETPVLDVLVALQRASWLVRRVHHGRARLHMLESLGLYVRQKLEARGARALDEAHDAHRRLMVSLALRMREQRQQEGEASLRKHASMELDDLRAAGGRAVSVGDVDEAVILCETVGTVSRLCGISNPPLELTDHILQMSGLTDENEARTWYARGMALLGRDTARCREAFAHALEPAQRAGLPKLRADALAMCARMWMASCDTYEAGRLLEEAVGLDSSPLGRALLLFDRAALAGHLEQYDVAHGLLDEADSAMSSSSWPRGHVLCQAYRAHTLASSGELRNAKEQLGSSIQQLLELQDVSNAGLARVRLAWVLLALGESEAAETMFRDQLAQYRLEGRRSWMSESLGLLASTLTIRGDDEEVGALTREGGQIARRTGSVAPLVWNLEVRSGWLVRQGRADQAAASMRDCVAMLPASAPPSVLRRALVGWLHAERAAGRRAEPAHLARLHALGLGQDPLLAPRVAAILGA